MKELITDTVRVEIGEIRPLPSLRGSGPYCFFRRCAKPSGVVQADHAVWLYSEPATNTGEPWLALGSSFRTRQTGACRKVVHSLLLHDHTTGFRRRRPPGQGLGHGGSDATPPNRLCRVRRRCEHNNVEQSTCTCTCTCTCRGDGMRAQGDVRSKEEKSLCCALCCAADCAHAILSPPDM